MTRTPTTTWQTNEEPSFYIDLDRLESVRNVYILVKFGAANVTVYTGLSRKLGITRLCTKFRITGARASFNHYCWNKIDINRDTRYLQLDFQDASIEIAEIAVSNLDNQKVAVNAVTDRTASDPNLSKLIDEQDVVQCPPTYMSEAHFDEKYLRARIIATRELLGALNFQGADV